MNKNILDSPVHSESGANPNAPHVDQQLNSLAPQPKLPVPHDTRSLGTEPTQQAMDMSGNCDIHTFAQSGMCAHSYEPRQERFGKMVCVDLKSTDGARDEPLVNLALDRN